MREGEGEEEEEGSGKWGKWNEGSEHEIEGKFWKKLAIEIVGVEFER